MQLPRGNAVRVLSFVALVVLGIAVGSVATRQNLLPGGPVYDRSQLTSKVTAARAEGYESGHSSGYDDGYSAGKSAGYDDGYSAGQDAGSSDATAQHDQGYADGYSAGYNAGVSCGASNTTDAYLYCTANTP